MTPIAYNKPICPFWIFFYSSNNTLFLSSLISYFDGAVYFVEHADSTGVDFIHADGIDKKLIPTEATFVDYDNDGDLDLCLVNTT